MTNRWQWLLATLALAAILGPLQAGDAAKKIRVVIIDGQNNHNWRATTPVMKKALEDSGRFTVDVATTPERVDAPQRPKQINDELEAKYKAALEKYKAAIQPYRDAMEK